MHARPLLRLTGALVATIMLFSIAATPAASPASTAAAGTSLAPAVREFLATSPANAKMDVIVTFRNKTGLNRLAGKGVWFEHLDSVPMALITLSARDIRDVASWTETRSVYDNAELELHLDESTRMVKADRVWEGRNLRQRYRGNGVGVAVLDTGADTLHPDLPYGTKVKKNFYIGANPAGAGEPQLFVEGARQTDTEHGHGTHVASTIAGTGAASGGRYQGVAPGAKIYAFKVGAGASVLPWWAARAFDWVIQHGRKLNIRVISNSWGGGGGSDYDPHDPINVLSKSAYDKGIVTVFSAGNGGGPNKLGRNAVSPYVVSVAAANKDYTKASFSSVGRPGGDMKRDANGLYRPTITGPGVNINAARSSMGAVMSQGTDPENPFYTTASGTSMSAPHVSGVIALMFQARPSLTAKQVIDILEGTAVDMPQYEQWEVGAGFVNAFAAVRAAEKGRSAFPPSTKGKTPSYELLQSGKFEGIALPGYAAEPVTDVVVDKIPLEVSTDVDAIYAEISWTIPAENIYLYLYDPDGNEVAASAGLTDVPLTFRTVVATSPEPGTWTIKVVGRVNTATQYQGFWGTYNKIKPTTVTDTRSRTKGVSGEVQVSAEVVYDTHFHSFQVPEDVVGVSARVEWIDPEQDIDLYIYDANGRLVGSSTNWNPDTGNPSEEATALSSDPMAPGEFAAGTWTIEVRGYLVTEPQAYTGAITVTRPAR